MRNYIGIMVVLAAMLGAGTAWGAVEVLADFESGGDLGYYDPSGNSGVISTDTPTGASTQSLKATLDDWYQWGEDGDYPDLGEIYFGFAFPSGKDLTGYSYLNYYIKGSSTTTQISRWNSVTVNGDAAGSGYDPGFDPVDLPSEWTYVSLALADFSPWWGGGADMSAVNEIEWGFGVETPGVMEVYIDHITLTTTPEEGELAEGPTPADCSDPFLTQTGLPVAGRNFSIVVGGIDSGCADSITWTRDGEAIPTGGVCSTVAPAGSTAGQTVTVDYYDQYNNHLDTVRDAWYADVGFATQPYYTIRIDHITLSDTPANGEIGAGSGYYVLSACESGDTPSWYTDDGVLCTTDSAGGSSTACIEIPTGDYAGFWCESYDVPVDVTGYANYFNFYMKVVGADPVDGWTSAGASTGGEGWDSGWWADGTWSFPAPGTWQYVSIPIPTEEWELWGPPDWSTLAAIGAEWGANGTYISFDNETNPEVFETGSAVFTLTQDMIDSDYFWTYMYTKWDSEPYVEIWSAADAIIDGGNCGGAKALTGVSGGGMMLNFNPLSEDDAGEYCATVTIEGVPETICTTVSGIAPEGSLPAAGIAALGLLAAACGLGGFVALRRKH